MAERNGYEDARAVRRAAGAILLDGQQVADTLQCGHCNVHWVVQHGSGIRRGWCLRCDRPTCGKPPCEACVPFEKKLDLNEKSHGRIPLL